MSALLAFFFKDWKAITITIAVILFAGVFWSMGADHVQVEWDRADQHRAELLQKERDKQEKEDYARSVAYEKQHLADAAALSHLQQLWETANANPSPDICRLDAVRVRLINAALSGNPAR
jgi:hypothetical protein